MGLFELFGRKARKSAARREFSSSSPSSPTRRDGAFSYRDHRASGSDDPYNPALTLALLDTDARSDHRVEQPAPDLTPGGGRFGGGGNTGDWGDSPTHHAGGGDTGGGGDGGGGGGGDVTSSLYADPMFNRHRNWRLTI